MKKWKRVFLAFGVFFVFVSFFLNFNYENRSNSSLKNKDFLSVLSNIPRQDRKRLDYFFRKLVATDSFGYVLLGDKPVALSSFRRKFFYSDQGKKWINWAAFLPSNLRMKKGYETWQKYSPLFPLKNYIIKIEKNPWVAGVDFLFMINKKAFVHTLKEHRADFERVLDEKVDPEAWLKRIKEKDLLGTVLHSHEGLLGILLGYGCQNAWIFNEFYSSKVKKDRCLEAVWEEGSQRYPGIWDDFFGINKLELSSILLPDFMGERGSLETALLKNK
jgi:hypothetical protein